MTHIEPTMRISAELVKSALLRNKPIMRRFNMPMTTAQAASFLKGAMMAEVARRGVPFVENEALDTQIRLLAQWLTTSDYRCCALLCGKVGNGKSTLVKALQSLLQFLSLRREYSGEHIGFAIEDAREIAWKCREEHKEWQDLIRRPMLAIDDLGTEPVEVVEYGNRLYPVIDLLYKRYDGQLFTIITTNLTPPEIRERYGERIADRLNEMAFRIVFENPSYRAQMASPVPLLENHVESADATPVQEHQPQPTTNKPTDNE